ncbi:MAG: PD-(D/E)XK nuclease family protein [Bacteroides sp.]|nr:PD-(D/E)XK nuclease family protein [Bacteroides sp.]MCM1085973.1 PD-(D/E)XK nuclease family protein [Bacteroides sp.]
MPRESSFIDYVCRHIERFDLRATDLQVVVPSVRLGRMLGKRLVRLAKEENRLPCFLPRFVTIDKLTTSFSGLGKADPTELLALLYTAYAETCAEAGIQARSLDRFWEWGRMLISDFNQIDNQLAPAQEILQYMAEEKRLGAWHLDLGSSQGRLQSGYLAFYELLLPLYRNFTQKLLAKNIAYTGLAGRTALERLPGLLQENALSNDTFFLFAGFNALTQAEEKIIKTLVREKKAEILWNADRHYLDDPMQEAGHFLRQYRKDPDLNHFLKDEDIADRIRHLKINVVECAQRTAQVKWAVRYIAQRGQTAGTALILNDESLFAPVMNALPEHISCNATLAAPLSGTFAGELLARLVEIRHYLLQNRSRSMTALQFLQLLRNPLLAALQKDKKALREKEEAVLNSHRAHYDFPEFTELFSENDPFCQAAAEFLRPPKDARPWHPIECLQRIARCWLNLSPEPGTQTELFSAPLNDFEQAYLLHVEQNCRTQLQVLERYPQLPLGEISVNKLLGELISGAELSYTGNPETSLNIMGMLETRGMNFEHAVLLSMNEGVLPDTPNPESFLLHGLRHFYRLPAQKEEAAMQAYHFYSLLQECGEVTLVYVNSPADRNAEKSRFVLQLQHELPDNVNLLPAPDFALMDAGFQTQGLRIEKTEAVIGSIKRRLEGRGISFSSLHTYFQCPMQFYLRYVLGLGEPPQVQDQMDPAAKGSVFHRAMERFFKGEYPNGKNLLNVDLCAQDIETLRKHIPELAELAMQDEFAGGSSESGANRMAFEEVKIFLERYAAALEEETGHATLSVLGCEQRLNQSFDALVPGLKLVIDGFADRLDLYEDRDGKRLRIIDYKTGHVYERFLDPCEWDELREKDYKQALQLSFYIFLYRHRFPQDRRPLQACICGLKNQGKMFALGNSLPLAHQSEAEYLERMEGFIRESVQDMLDPASPITCSGDEDTCRYCPFIQLCQSHADQLA